MILAELQADDRLTVSELADRVRLTPGPCHRRLRELERSGVITGYRALVAPRRRRDGIRGPRADHPGTRRRRHRHRLRSRRGESLGWLFVDAAGQAPPQYAVGALWRARRAVIVGDPLQLKPVVTLPWGGQRALAREFGVGEQWAPSRTSVQQVADRLAEHGTALPGPAGDEPVWVGTPLRVHRRCDRPMFDISNQIAYDGLMVFGTPDRPVFRDRNVWCDIRSATSNGHWIPAEGAELRSVLSQLRDAGVPTAQIRVISPFRMVADQAMKVHESVFPEVSGPDRENWVGTVHVMQGKEADVVVLVLGGNPDRPGAREFATREPNLLNVAVTRAKRRLYVIGNRGTWGNDPYFNVLAARMPAGYPAPDIGRSPQ